MADSATVESLGLAFKSGVLLGTSSHEGLSIVVNQLFTTPQESVEYKTARALYDFCVAHFPDLLTLMLLKVYKCSLDDLTRFRSILLLSEMLTDLRNRRFELSLVTLNDIKPLLISCLTLPEATEYDTNIFRIIVSSVASNVIKCDNDGWDELGDCILSLTNTDPLRAFNVFLDLPLLNQEFINRFLEEFVVQLFKVLLHPEQDWTLALETAIKLGIQRLDLTKEILENVMKSANELMSIEMEEYLQEGIEHLVKFIAKEAKSYKWSTEQCSFVVEFAYKISGIGTKSKEAAKKMYQIVTKLSNYKHNNAEAFKLSPPRVENQKLRFEDESTWYNTLTEASAKDILTLFASTGYDDSVRETTIKRLHDLLCDDEWRELNFQEIQNLKPELINCLKGKEMSENMFRILGQVVSHVAEERFIKEPWFELWGYIATEEFEKAVYIFLCLTRHYDDKNFMIPALYNLIPEMKKRLDHSPRELLVDNNCWVLAFTGAFCAAIRLIDSADHREVVKEIADKMIDSVKELVERGGMEVGVVRRAFRHLESIVEKQCDWYNKSEYKFTKDLLSRLYQIKGIKMESKVVLWRICTSLKACIEEEEVEEDEEEEEEDDDEEESNCN